MSDRACCLENHRAVRLNRHSPYEVWQNARTGQAELFVRSDIAGEMMAREVPQEAIEMLAQSRREPDSRRRARARRIVGVFILVAWLVLACATTAMLAAELALRLS